MARCACMPRSRTCRRSGWPSERGSCGRALVWRRSRASPFRWCDTSSLQETTSGAEGGAGAVDRSGRRTDEKCPRTRSAAAHGQFTSIIDDFCPQPPISGRRGQKTSPFSSPSWRSSTAEARRTPERNDLGRPRLQRPQRRQQLLLCPAHELLLLVAADLHERDLGEPGVDERANLLDVLL